MSGVKAVFACVVAVCVVGVVGTSVAAAATCPEAGLVTLCIKLAPVEGTFKFNGSGVREITITVSGIGLSLRSNEVTFSGELSQGKVLSTAVVGKDFILEFRSLTVFTPLNCTALNFKTNPVSATFSDPISTMTFTPESPAITF